MASSITAEVVGAEGKAGEKAKKEEKKVAQSIKSFIRKKCPCCPKVEEELVNKGEQLVEKATDAGTKKVQEETRAAADRMEGKGEKKGEGKGEEKGEEKGGGKGDGKGEEKSKGKHEGKGEGKHDGKGEGKQEGKAGAKKD